jgi:dipeptidyl aminopeptidase/acylaminoacyl peptidase
MTGAPVLLMAAQARAAPTPPTIEMLARKPLVRGAALSPDGKHIAMVLAEEGQDHGAFIDLMDADDPDLRRRRVHVVDVDAQGIAWGAPDRLLVFVQNKLNVAVTDTGSHMADDVPVTLSRIVAMGLDGSQQVVLFGPETSIRAANADLTTIVDMLPDDPDHVLMRASEPQSGVWSLYRVDIRTGAAVPIERGGLGAFFWWMQNNVAVLRADVNDTGRVMTFFSRRPGETDWKAIHKTRVSEIERPDFQILTWTADPLVWLVAATAEGESGSAVHKFNVGTATLGEAVLKHPDRDVVGWLIDAKGGLVAAAYGDDRLGYEFTDPVLAAHYRGINKYFSDDSNVELVDITPDHNRLLARVSSPTDPGGYYFYDRAAVNLKGLSAVSPALDSDSLSPMEMLDVKARDGLALRAYLTAPRVAGPRPLIVLPHGGPELRDSYVFDLFAQTFAAQGWMVLQPNFRGSGGYGRAFAEAGHRHWGDLMQQDVEDAADHVIASGRVDPKRVAIWGASYGGYAALMGPVRRPDFYRCAVSLAGVTDIAKLLEFVRRDDLDGVVVNYEIKRVGDPKTDAALIAAESPVTHAAAIRIPVLLLHGTKDQIVDPAQSREMADALKRAGKTYTYLEIKDAGHHISDWDEKMTKTILQTSVDFLAKALA